MPRCKICDYSQTTVTMVQGCEVHILQLRRQLLYNKEDGFHYCDVCYQVWQEAAAEFNYQDIQEKDLVMKTTKDPKP